MADILWAAAVVSAILIATVGLGFVLVLLLGLGERVSAKFLQTPTNRIAEVSTRLRNGVTRL